MRGTHYLEFHDEAANSHKFYRVTFHGDGMALIEWGRIGTEGQSQTKDAGAAQAKLNEKLGKGYQAAGPVKKIDPFTKVKSDREIRERSAEREPAGHGSRTRVASDQDIWTELAATGRKVGT